MLSESKIEVKRTPVPLVYSKLEPIKVSEVYNSFWYFAAERQRIFFERLLGRVGPWTKDPILQTYKFTNAYRALDRVSQYLIRNVIYRDDLPSSPREVFFRIMLFKFFNKIETWELIESDLGAVTWESYEFKRLDQLLSAAMQKGERIYSAAYIMPPASRRFGKEKKHQNHLLLLELMITEFVPERLNQLPSMQSAFELLRAYPSIGDFLAYQFVTDINYSELTNFSEKEFVVPGPGARDGLAKCFVNRAGLNEPELIKLVYERQDFEFERLGIKYQDLFGRPLQLIDCQNLFCEIDKYSRVAHPDIAGVSGRTRIKQSYKTAGQIANPFFPPKWGINDKVEEWISGV